MFEPTQPSHKATASLYVPQILAWGLVALWCGFIFFMSAHTGNDLDNGSGFVAAIKKQIQMLLTPLFGPDTDIASVLGHFCEYVVLGMLLAHALHWPLAQGTLFICALALGSLYGMTDELHQIFVPGRVCDVADWITDTLGCATGIGGYLALRSRRKRKRLSNAAKQEG